MSNENSNTPNALNALDLISRKAAIDALKEVSEHYTDKGREWHPHVNFMVQAIEELPSAQPEITLESAIDYLNSIGWMQSHDKQMYEYGQRHAQPERKVGAWIYEDSRIVEKHLEYRFRCSFCECESVRASNYCPVCGAEMESIKPWLSEKQE